MDKLASLTEFPGNHSVGTEMRPDELANHIRERLEAHLCSLGIDGNTRPSLDKQTIRNSHAAQRAERAIREAEFVSRYGQRLLNKYFASGAEIVPDRVKPVITEVVGDGEQAQLFRFATLLWSVPVSRGFGRRMRFLVQDHSNGKLIGIFALNDPVFNLTARDRWIGWGVEDRRLRLVNVMDAYVVGSVPPYSQLLGGKLVAALMTSQEVRERFAAKYRHSTGIISKKTKSPALTLITVTSALGHSSLYNRLRLPDLFDFKLIGKTQGWGHFHVPEEIISDMRLLLELEGHSYANGHQFGDGPNWRMRLVRVALTRIGMEPDLLRHGITREVYAAPLTANWRDHLLGNASSSSATRPSAAEIAEKATVRWLLPRAQRMPEYKLWTRADTWEQIQRLITEAQALVL